jgi:hypothetical protein
MVERMVGSTFSSYNMLGVLDNNNNPYRNMIMDAMWMNQSHAGQCPIIEQSNVHATMFFLSFERFWRTIMG